MIRLIFCLRRLPHLSREEFQTYWSVDHARLMEKHADALRVTRYTQLHTLDLPVSAGLAAIRGAPEEYDGVAEACFASADDLIATRKDPAATAAAMELLEDEKRFIDLARSPIFIVQEREIVRKD